MSEDYYGKLHSEFMYAPILPRANFNNEDATPTIQALAFRDVVPYELVDEDDELPLLLPKREDEDGYSVSSGRNPDYVKRGVFALGAGGIISKSHPFLMLMRLGGDVTVTHTQAMIWTIIAKAKADIGASDYFHFDVISAAGIHKKYQAWFNVGGADPAPTAEDCYDPIDGDTDGIHQDTQGKMILHEINISAATTAQEVSNIIATRLDAVVDVGAANGGTTTTTVTNANNGAVMFPHDIDSGLTIAVSTVGIDKRELEFDALGTQDKKGFFGFHFQHSLSTENRVYDLFGCSVAEHILRCDENEVMEDEPIFTVASIKEQYGTITQLKRPRSPYGTQWTKGYSAYGNLNNYKVYRWSDTAAHNSISLAGTALGLTIRGWKVHIKNNISHHWGGIFATESVFNNRECEIGVNLMPKSHELYEHQRKWWADYDGVIALEMKAVNPQDSNLFITFTCDTARIIPFDEKVMGAERERYDITFRPAPDATFGYDLRTAIPSYMYGGD